MRSMLVLMDALQFIEGRLPEVASQEAIAAHSYCSVSGLQKLFRYALGIGVRDYIERRRLTLAAHALLRTQDTVTDVALAYDYQSPEVFTRAFRRLWGMTPTAFRGAWRFSGLFPQIVEIREENGMMRRKMDISELYETLRDLKDTYVLTFDIVGLMEINAVSHAAGDQTIVECMRRIDGAMDDSMFAFRIGGDEFALVTGYTDAEAVRALAKTVLVQNGKLIYCGNQAVPVSMRAGAVRLGGEGLRYVELFNALHGAVLRTDALQEVHFVQ